MRRTASFLAILLATLSGPPGATAQMASDASSPGFGETALAPPRWIEGKVADVDPVTTTVTLVKLEDGTNLTVPSASRVAGSEVRSGTAIGARYVETVSGKVTVLLRADSEVQAP